MTALLPDHQLLITKMQSAVDDQLRKIIALSSENGSTRLHSMLAYQMGWEGEGDLTRARGKGIRPLLVLLTEDALDGSWNQAISGACAVELLHNFSLIHDDIEDQSDTRRGRPTLWKKWGIAQAINTGDAMFSLAGISLLGLSESLSPETALKASRIFHQTCLRLTQGQYLDIAFEDRQKINLEEYWQMVAGKTAALIAFSTELGALCAEVSPDRQSSLRDFGHFLGLAYQVQDDILGIWGKQERIGKSTSGDLISGKKTLPVIFGLTQDEVFSQRWTAHGVQPDYIPQMAERLEASGARAYAQSAADRLTSISLGHLKDARLEGEAGEALSQLAEKLLNRTV